MREVERLRNAQNTIADAVQQELARFWVAHSTLAPHDFQEALLEVIPELVSRYGDLAATVAAEWYEENRFRAVGVASNTVLAEANMEAVRGSIRWAAGAGGWDQEVTQAALAVALARHVRNVARRTILQNLENDSESPRWAHVMRGRETCGFCRMLASRGFVYVSEQTAGAGRHWHDRCDCEVVPEFALSGAEREAYDREVAWLRREYARVREVVEARGDAPTAKHIVREWDRRIRREQAAKAASGAGRRGKRVVRAADGVGYRRARVTHAAKLRHVTDFREVLTAQGWVGAVEQLDDAAFDRFRSPLPRVYRGVTSGGTGRPARELHAAFLTEGIPWVGDGVYGDGWYAATNIRAANQYAGKVPRSIRKGGTTREHIGDSVIELAFRPEARIVDIDKLPAHFENKGLEAAKLGYDAIRTLAPTLDGDYYLILNRSAVVARRLKE